MSASGKVTLADGCASAQRTARSAGTYVAGRPPEEPPAAAGYLGSGRHAYTKPPSRCGPVTRVVVTLRDGMNAASVGGTTGPVYGTRGGGGGGVEKYAGAVAGTARSAVPS